MSARALTDGTTLRPMLVMLVQSFVSDPEELLEPVGWAFDADPRFRLTRAGPDDPMPKVRGTATEALAAHAGGERGVNLLLEFGWEGSGHLRGYPLGEPATSTQDLDLGLPEDDSPEFPGDLATLFVRLCEAMDGAWGAVATPDTLRRFWKQRWRQARKAGTMENLQKAPGGTGFEQAVQDVFWMNYFGPAFVERWGIRLDGAGVRQVATANGGRVVWACEDWRDLEPPGGPSDDWQGARITDPAPKRSFYDALGLDTFMHENLQAGAPGERVPTVAEHRAAVGRGAMALDVPWRGGGITEAVPDADRGVAGADPEVVRVVGRLRGLGFLAAEDGTDVEVAGRIDAAHRDQWGDALDPTDPLMSVVVLAADTDRVWWEDLEADVLPGGGVYEHVVPRWAALVGVSPDSMTETWPDGDGGPTITMVVGGEQVEASAEHLEDWIDLGVLAQLDAAVGTPDRRLFVVEPFDQTAVVVAVAESDREELAEVLGRPLLRPASALDVPGGGAP